MMASQVEWCCVTYSTWDSSTPVEWCLFRYRYCLGQASRNYSTISNPKLCVPGKFGERLVEVCAVYINSTHLPFSEVPKWFDKSSMMTSSISQVQRHFIFNNIIVFLPPWLGVNGLVPWVSHPAAGHTAGLLSNLLGKHADHWQLAFCHVDQSSTIHTDSSSMFGCCE